MQHPQTRIHCMQIIWRYLRNIQWCNEENMWSKLTFRTRKQELWIARVWSHPSLALGEEPDPELLQFKLGGLPALGAMISHKGHSHDGSLLRLTVDASRWQSAFGWQWPHVASPSKKPVAKDWAKPTSGSSTLSAIFINILYCPCEENPSHVPPWKQFFPPGSPSVLRCHAVDSTTCLT